MPPPKVKSYKEREGWRETCGAKEIMHLLQGPRSALRKLVNSVLQPLGIQVAQRKFIERSHRITYRGALSYLKKLGFNPETVIDVGVGYGTMELYEAFPRARHILIEPLEEARASIESIARRFPHVEHTMAAATRRSGQTTINVHPDIARSSVYWESDYDPNIVTSRKVKAVTIDQVFREKRLRGLILLKIDVQGAELDVLAGAKETLKQTECVVLETSLYQFFEGGPLIADIIEHMEKISFVVFDVWALQYRNDGTLLMIDFAFVRKRGVIRGPDKFHPNGD